MRITQVRNATLLIEYAGSTLLIDPLLAEQGAYPGFPGTVDSHRANPLVGLPLPLAQLLDVDAVLVTHLHLDHWDAVARRVIPRAMPLFAQNQADADAMRADGFTDVRPPAAGGATVFNGIRIDRTGGQHGSDALMAVLGARMGIVSGLVLRHADEPTLYIAGDTVWHADIQAALDTYVPDVVVLNCGDAQVPGLGSMIMDAADLRTVWAAAPQATIVASHLEAVNHCTLSRPMLRGFLKTNGMEERVRVPEDGEALEFKRPK